MRVWLDKAFVSPRSRQLTGKPGVARLGNGDNAWAVLAKQHRCHSIGFLRNTSRPEIFCSPHFAIARRFRTQSQWIFFQEAIFRACSVCQGETAKTTRNSHAVSMLIQFVQGTLMPNGCVGTIGSLY